MSNINKTNEPLSLTSMAKKKYEKENTFENTILKKKELLDDIRKHLMNQFQMNKLLFSTDEEYIEQIKDVARKYLADHDRLLTKEVINEYVDYIIKDIRGIGVLDGPRTRKDVNEIKVVKYNKIYLYLSDGRKVLAKEKFDTQYDLLHVIEKIAAYNNKSFNYAQPELQASLPGKMRVHALHESISLNGPIMNIRKFPKRLSLKDLVMKGACSNKVAYFMSLIPKTRLTFAAGGPTGSGKTTLGMALYDFAPMDLSIVSIEDVPEFVLIQPDWRPLVTRGANAEGQGAITISDLIADCMRLTPDVIIVGEVRKPKDAYEMLQVFHTGHKGSFVTIHISSPRNFPVRLANMILDSGRDIGLNSSKEQIADAFDYIIFQEREIANVKTKREGRYVKGISEITGYDYKTNEVTMEDIFVWKSHGVNSKTGDKLGELEPTGVMPEKLFAGCYEYGIPFGRKEFTKMFLDKK